MWKGQRESYNFFGDAALTVAGVPARVANHESHPTVHVFITFTKKERGSERKNKNLGL